MEVAPAPGCGISDGTLLGGRLVYRQRRDGYRTGIEPVLLAAAVPARPGDKVVEAGIGAGAGLMALAARVAVSAGVGIEIDPALVALARANFAANTIGCLRVEQGDVTAWRAQEPYDHAFANPPWHRDDGTLPPDEGRRRAKMASPVLLRDWACALSRGLRRRGTLSFILPASSMAAGILALDMAGCPEIAIQPLWPCAGDAAKLVILRGVRLGRGPTRMLPGLALHCRAESYTPEAERILRAGEALAF